MTDETELKTLKDLIYSGLGENWVCKKTLRAEAVKWVKELSDTETDTFISFEGDGNTGSAVNWIKHFFNLTEDLK